jgi:hypothetical protein
VHNYNKTHLQKQNQTNNTQHRICEIHVSRYIFGVFFCGKVCAKAAFTCRFNIFDATAVELYSLTIMYIN